MDYFKNICLLPLVLDVESTYDLLNSMERGQEFLTTQNLKKIDEENTWGAIPKWRSCMISLPIHLRKTQRIVKVHNEGGAYSGNRVSCDFFIPIFVNDQV